MNASENSVSDRLAKQLPISLHYAASEVARALFGRDAFLELKGNCVIKPGLEVIVVGLIYHGWARIVKRARQTIHRLEGVRSEVERARKGELGSAKQLQRYLKLSQSASAFPDIRFAELEGAVEKGRAIERICTAYF